MIFAPLCDILTVFLSNLFVFIEMWTVGLHWAESAYLGRQPGEPSLCGHLFALSKLVLCHPTSGEAMEKIFLSNKHIFIDPQHLITLINCVSPTLF